MSEITTRPCGGTARRTPEMILRDIEMHKHRAAENLILIGLDLIDAKAQLQHGQWLDFLAQAGFSERTATNYMRVAGATEQTPGLASMTFSKALALVQAPEDVRQQLLEDGVEDKSAAEIRRLTKELQETKDKLKTTDQCFRNEIQATKAETRAKYKAEQRVRELEAELVAKPETVEVEVAPPDYEDLKGAVETLRAQLADAEAAVEEAENRAAGAIAADADADPDHDRLSAVEFVGACTEFMGHVEFYPYHKTELAALDDVSRRRMEIFAHGVQNWAVRMLGALAEAGGAVDCEGAVSGV